MSQYVLALPSWYPSKVSPSNGDFVQRHVQAIAPFFKQHVLFVVKQDVEVRGVEPLFIAEINETDNYIEKTFYYSVGWRSISILHRFLSHQKYIKTYKNAIEEHFAIHGSPSLVHLHVCFKAGYLALWLKKKFNLKIVFTEHYSGFTNRLVEQQPMHLSLAKRIFANASYHISITNNLKDIVNRYNGNDKLATSIVPNVVNTNLFNFRTKPEGVFQFCHISNLSPQKNIDAIIEACDLLKKKSVPFKFQFIGAKPQVYLALAQQKGLLNENVIFTDEVSSNEVADFMQTSHALVMLSLHENLPCTILEALCCGTPVISSKVGGVAEIIDNENGILVDTKPAALAQAMEQMMANYDSYNLHQIAVNSAARFNTTVVGQQIAQIYKSLLA